ncbi:helix-turn-helix domain-containing protein [Tersicoccus sp. MR15.9]|uniref:MarR family transcriptional regulator n=1 Tax=Tersicoccus mangrovi TaxID=3121635 RepID=UPI002FE6B022
MSPTLVADAPADVWSALAPLLAGQARVRLSRDGGRSYPQRYERDLTSGLPTVPAAVRIFSRTGTCRTLCLDFDSSVGGTDLVDADVARVRDWLTGLHVRWIEDRSPSGGRHVYVPLRESIPFAEARDVVEALGNRCASLDRSPHQNLQHGCIRVPGSAHKLGGHQVLVGSLARAYDVARRPNGPESYRRLHADLVNEIAAVRALRAEQAWTPAPEQSPQDEALAAGRMSRTMARIAATGLYDTGRYASDSEARQAVLTGAAAAGMSLLEVDRRMKQGIWPGLASFYARYRAAHRMGALKRDWTKAGQHLAKPRPDTSGKSHDHRSTTSELNTQPQGLHGGHSIALTNPDDEHRFIRTWRNALYLSEHRYQDSRDGLHRRMLLRALGEAAHKIGNRFVEFGSRALAVATGLDHTTVVAHLHALRDEAEPLIALVERGRGKRGDLYQLQIPTGVRDSAEALPWRAGRQHALRPVFRELGVVAALVYEQLEHSPAATTMDLVRATRLSRTAVSAALEDMAAWRLVERVDGRWKVGAATSLTVVAEMFGVLEAVAAQVARYRAERAAWHLWLAAHAAAGVLLPQPEEDYPWELFEGPPDEMTLVHAALSGR